MQICIGALGPKLSEQLKGHFPATQLAVFDKLAFSISMLKVHGLLSDGEASRAAKRLVKKIEREHGQTPL